MVEHDGKSQQVDPKRAGQSLSLIFNHELPLTPIQTPRVGGSHDWQLPLSQGKIRSPPTPRHWYLHKSLNLLIVPE